jgi:hypothetical protein
MSINVPNHPPRPVPSEGFANAICAHVVDMGEVLSDYPGNPITVDRCVRFFFELEETIPETVPDDMGNEVPVDPGIVGKPFMLSTFDVALKHGDRSNLRKVVNGFLGKNAPRHLAGFDVETLQGLGVTLNVQHKIKDDGGVFAYIKPDGINLPMKGATKLTVLSEAPPPWVDEQKQKNASAVAKWRSTGGLTQADIDAIPF